MTKPLPTVREILETLLIAGYPAEYERFYGSPEYGKQTGDRAIEIALAQLNKTYAREFMGLKEMQDDFEGCSWFDEFGYHGKECDRPGGCIERQNRDELRAELKQAIQEKYGVTELETKKKEK